MGVLSYFPSLFLSLYFSSQFSFLFIFLQNFRATKHKCFTCSPMESWLYMCRGSSWRNLTWFIKPSQAWKWKNMNSWLKLERAKTIMCLIKILVICIVNGMCCATMEPSITFLCMKWQSNTMCFVWAWKLDFMSYGKHFSFYKAIMTCEQGEHDWWQFF